MDSLKVIYRSCSPQDIILFVLLYFNELVYFLISSSRRLIPRSRLNDGLLICLTFLKRSISLRHSAPPILIEWLAIHGIFIVAFDSRMLGVFRFGVVLITKLFLLLV